MYGGMCQGAFFESALELVRDLTRAEIRHTWCVTVNESLVQRARNTTVATFLKSDFERLMFIDADIDFSPQDVANLWNLDADVAVAAYPMKRPDSPLSAWKKGKLVEITEAMTEPFEVDFAGTGFMMIKRAVFEKMIQRYPATVHQEGHVGECYALFDCELHGTLENRVYLSEDYTFCHRWRYLGGKILCDPTIRLGHWGTHRYGA